MGTPKVIMPRVRIQAYLSEKGIKNGRVDKILGKSAGFWVKARNPTTETLESFFRNFDDLSTEWVFRGKGEMIRQKSYDIMENAAREAVKLDIQQIPLFDTRKPYDLQSVAEGVCTGALGFVQLPNMPQCDGMICVRGDALLPRVKAGDMLGFKVVEVNSKSILWGEMYLVELTIGGECFILPCIIKPSERGDAYITLTSPNENHAPKELRLSDVHALAIVKFTLSINTIK